MYSSAVATADAVSAGVDTLSPSQSFHGPRPPSPVLDASFRGVFPCSGAWTVVVQQEPGMAPEVAAAAVRARDAKAVVVVDPFSSGALLAQRWCLVSYELSPLCL